MAGEKREGNGGLESAWQSRRIGSVECRSGDVLVWWVDRESAICGDLTSAEEAEYSGFVAGPVRETWRRSRMAVRSILSGLAKVDPVDLTIERGGAGKPFVAGGELEFSLSHSGGQIVVAVGRRAVGVDVEAGDRERPWLELARRYFPPAEAEALAALPPGERRAEFLRMWVGKEAALKCLGTGLAGYLERAVCRRVGGDVRGVGVDSRELAVVGFHLPDGSPGAVAWEGGARRVRLLRPVW